MLVFSSTRRDHVYANDLIVAYIVLEYIYHIYRHWLLQHIPQTRSSPVPLPHELIGFRAVCLLERPSAVLPVWWSLQWRHMSPSSCHQVRRRVRSSRQRGRPHIRLLQRRRLLRGPCLGQINLPLLIRFTLVYLDRRRWPQWSDPQSFLWTLCVFWQGGFVVVKRFFHNPIVILVA